MDRKQPEKLTPLTKAGGDGKWGQMHDAYFLAEGDPDKLNAAFAGWETDFGKTGVA